ncbi:ABC transporter permease [Conexibacter sp. SYSU D00693]|uniref:MlaE family ABC transporter permease n=1 Tax=Conexibacter sp. SYSU D00693 TaxID=2812560 RepID=UPI001F11E06F|nr:ABC transporter permease [Conexibacter sp. SYSU D00693]
MEAGQLSRPALPKPPTEGARTRWAPPGPVVEIGSMLVLLGTALRRAVRGPLDYGPELVSQLRFVLGICLFPLVLTAFALSFGPAGIQASNFFELFGALDRMGGAYQIIVVRLFAPLVVAITLAGAAGTAICADLGAREVREETDALRVLGVDPVKQLVVPRLLAMMAAGVLFNIFAIAAGMLGAIVVLWQNDAAIAPFLSTFFSNATPLELAASFVKSAIYGAVIATVCCSKGIRASGGAQGVGRAVNAAVVVCFASIGFIDYAYTQLVLGTNPLLSQVRG